MKNTELDNLLRTKLLMNYKNNKTLSENILTLKNKLLLEQGVDSSEITDKQLKNMDINLLRIIINQLYS